MHYLKKVFGGIHVPFYLDLSLTILRIVIGIVMLQAGLSKFPMSHEFVRGVKEMGFPAATLFAYLAAGSEVLGGLFFILGLCTRLGGLGLALVMAVAAFIFHAKDPIHVKLPALLIFLVSIQYIFLGGGKFSLDHLIRKKWF